MAQRVPKGPIYLNVALEHMLHDWTPPAAARDVPAAPIVQARPEEAERLHAAFLEAGGKGDPPSDSLMYVPIRYCFLTDPFGTIKLERQSGNTWVPYVSGTWSQTIVRAVLTCKDPGGSGIADAKKTQTLFYNTSVDIHVDFDIDDVRNDVGLHAAAAHIRRERRVRRRPRGARQALRQLGNRLVDA